MGKIFISYRREDARSEAARLRDRLVSKLGAANVFMDVDNLQPGQRFDQDLTKALNECDVLLAVIGSRWLDLLHSRAHTGERDYVRDEIANALASGIKVIPVLIDQTPLPRADQLPPDMHNLVLHQKYDVSHEYFGRDVDALIQRLMSAEATTLNDPVHPLSFLAGIPKRIVWAALLFAGFAVLMATLNGTYSEPPSNDKNEMSVYFARCDNSALTFLECTKNGGKLIASIVEVYRADPNSQTVIRVGYGGAGLYKFHSCTVADRANWSCMYNDGSAKIDLSQGQYSEFSSSEIKMKEIKLRGQVSYAQYRSLYNPW